MAKTPKLKKPAKKPIAGKKAKKVIALFPEAAFGPALNSVGIGQALKKLGHKVVFLSDPGFLDVYKGYGFEAHAVNLSEPMPAEEMAKFWVDFINGHIPNFRKIALRPDRQLCEGLLGDDRRDGEMGGEGSARRARQGEARCHLRRQCHPVPGDQALCPRQQASPGCGSSHARKTRSRIRIFRRISRAAARRTKRALPNTASISTPRSSRSMTTFNAFLKSVGEKKYPLGQFFEASPAHEHPALSDGGEIQAAAQAFAQAVPVSRGLRAQRRALQGAAVPGEQRQAPALCELSARWARAIRNC